MFRFIFVCLSLLTITACQTVPYQGQARNVRIKPQKEGVISIPVQYRDEDRLKAETTMAKNCKPYVPQITQEGEVAVGTKVDSNGKETDRASTEREVGTLFGIPLISGEAAGKNTSTSSTTTQIKEWHISYKCDRSQRASIQ